jgi:hypothetical protein
MHPGRYALWPHPLTAGVLSMTVVLVMFRSGMIL